jgi:acetyl-CoA carboxylase alpha subunit
VASATQLEFEKPIAELERQIDEIKKTAGDSQISVAAAIEPLERKLEDLREEVYKHLTPFQPPTMSGSRSLISSSSTATGLIATTPQSSAAGRVSTTTR